MWRKGRDWGCKFRNLLAQIAPPWKRLRRPESRSIPVSLMHTSYDVGAFRVWLKLHSFEKSLRAHPTKEQAAMSKIVTPAEAARTLSIGRNFLYDLLHSGNARAHLKLNTLTRVPGRVHLGRGKGDLFSFPT